MVLKDPKDFIIVGKLVGKLVCKRTKRLDTPAKINGTAEYGIDVKLSGMAWAALEQCLVIGGAVKSFYDSRIRAMSCVIDVVQIPDGLAVVAKSCWQAKKARDVLTVLWAEGKGSGD